MYTFWFCDTGCAGKVNEVQPTLVWDHLHICVETPISLFVCTFVQPTLVWDHMCGKLDNDSQVPRTCVSWVCHVNISFMHSMQWSMVTFIIYVLEWQPKCL